MSHSIQSGSQILQQEVGAELYHKVPSEGLALKLVVREPQEHGKSGHQSALRGCPFNRSERRLAGWDTLVLALTTQELSGHSTHGSAMRPTLVVRNRDPVAPTGEAAQPSPPFGNSAMPQGLRA